MKKHQEFLTRIFRNQIKSPSRTFCASSATPSMVPSVSSAVIKVSIIPLPIVPYLGRNKNTDQPKRVDFAKPPSIARQHAPTGRPKNTSTSKLDAATFDCATTCAPAPRAPAPNPTKTEPRTVAQRCERRRSVGRFVRRTPLNATDTETKTVAQQCEQTLVGLSDVLH